MSTETANKGLEGIVALSSSVSSIVDGVLTYRGYNIDDLAENTTFEEVIYLLLNDDLPTQAQLDELNQQLNDARPVEAAFLEVLKQLPITHSPMERLRTGISLLGLYDNESEDNSTEANRRKAIRLIAQMPTVIAAQERIRRGKAPVAPKPGLSTAASFLQMMHDSDPDPIAVEALDKALILHADHELNASTFAARQTVSTLADIYSAVTSAVGTLKGPLHGGANEQVIRTLQKIGEVSKVAAFLNDALENKERIMGFGHRVYKDGDPRAKHLKKMSYELGKMNGEMKWYEMSDLLEKDMLEKKGMKPNVDFYSASVYFVLGIPIDLYTPIFALSRISGWVAHILEQYGNNRLIRPRADYTGPVSRVSKPIAERG
ncbi:citrate synthase [bacterium (Candidatus Blackallbacteria) CG17_big_fil_post_rev_8_21_14_2_50_48_46]|uniref:Citrate synthase n=1 Tax=bacterium (Candidatus Blackallbacteria) CG17_big_fil_post_rev_8_21_14_2_50_48_46 TaxID=2014261 RepID=A0A2M7FYY4_9BACT|nr:MAG: citrate synthase [bacterium (Candidatus Blackallbacteria) CG18_big_fil_WC_8_21_14_2_50_49_26]PIW14557.1 MAG: citrate synthase [bacterium (Candidatus Blackallbacteria) CG17_big_fil_post_rev_8_21_14_2_50_48_46]PIW47242.1 MAG: citrate synthase [bacterium (Candidatus Blackallbacteria) CG13_big_fil_rev_8_21_14_2_50_49_14]